MRSGSGPVRLPLFVGCALVAFALPQVALAVSTCRWNDFDGSMTVDTDLAATIERSGDAIFVDGASCVDTGGTATVSNIAVIFVQVVDSTFNRKITISLAGGPFAPGLETGPSPDLWFRVGIPGNQCVLLQIVGSAGVDTVRWGGTGPPQGGTEYINLNANETADVDFDVRAEGSFHCILARFVGGGGSDVVSGLGGLGTDAPAKYPMTLAGGAGADSLTGGDSADSLAGNIGNDLLTGGRRADSLSGGDGADRLRGQEGPDAIEGGRGQDILVGGPRGDLLDGGPGFDRCNGGLGRDQFRRCEKVL